MAPSPTQRDQALQQAEYSGKDLIGANLAINVNRPTSTRALPIPRMPAG